MNLQQWRTAQGLDTTEAAARLGISQASVSRIENGEQFPSPETMSKLFLSSGGEIKAADLHDAWAEAKRAKEAAE
jgi:transcriptional regulator with XRE-family HTH domain